MTMKANFQWEQHDVLKYHKTSTNMHSIEVLSNPVVGWKYEPCSSGRGSQTPSNSKETKTITWPLKGYNIKHQASFENRSFIVGQH